MAENTTSGFEESLVDHTSFVPSPLGRIAIVDDEIELLQVLCERLKLHGFDVAGFSRPSLAIEAIRNQDFDVLLTDMMMPEVDGLSLLRTLLVDRPLLAVIMMTGQATVQTAVEALKLGAVDFVVKPFKLQFILPVITRAIDIRRLRMENLQLRETVAIQDLCRAIGYSSDLNTLLEKVVDAAVQQCEADDVSIMLPTSREEELYIAAVRGPNRDSLLGQRTPLANGIAGWVARNRQTLTLKGAVSDDRFAPAFPRPELQSAVSIPLVAGGKLVGVLNVATSRHQSFTMGHVKALNFIASAGAAAIENVSLYAELRRAELKYRRIFENIAEGIWHISPSDQILLANPAMAFILGFDSAHSLCEEITQVGNQVHLDPERWRLDKERLANSEKLETHEYQLLRKDKTPCWVSMKMRMVKEANGSTYYLEATAEDITERKHAEASLHERNQTLNALIHAAPLAICSLDLDFTVSLWNPAAERVFGWSQEEVIGKPLPTIPLGDQSESAHILNLVMSKQPITGREMKWIAKSGHYIDVSVSAAALENPYGTIHGLMLIVADMTERNDLEAQLRQAQKLEALGSLAGGIAHDFNNLLTVINGFSSIVLSGMEPENPNRECLQQVCFAGDSATKLTRQLLVFSRNETISPTVVDLGKMVQDTEKMLRRLIGEHIELVVDIAPTLWKIEVDSGQIEQVIVNLCVNARDAMPDGGRLSIRVDNVTLDETVFPEVTDIAPGEYVAIFVADTGSGMDDVTKSRAFDPFFTTKGPTMGTGLGLAVVYGIIKKAGGHISLRSEVGEGTQFSLFLPRWFGEYSEEIQDRRSKEAFVGGSETILLAEDEDPVRRVARVSLENAGYTVIDARGGEEALLIAEQFEGTIDLLVTDLVMPHMNGNQLADRLQRLRPKMKVLYMSGYIDESISSAAMGGIRRTLLQKPFSPHSLARKVREVLDAS